jgi:hypothetical protein
MKEYEKRRFENRLGHVLVLYIARDVLPYVPPIDPEDRYYQLLQYADYAINTSTGEMLKCRYPIEEIMDVALGIPLRVRRPAPRPVPGYPAAD